MHYKSFKTSTLQVPIAYLKKRFFSDFRERLSWTWTTLIICQPRCTTLARPRKQNLQAKLAEHRIVIDLLLKLQPNAMAHNSVPDSYERIKMKSRSPGDRSD